MNIEAADRCKNVIAFLTARANKDEEAAMVLAGSCEQALDLLLGMTDFALSQCEVMAKIVGLDMKAFLQLVGMTNTLLLDGIVNDG